MAAGEKYPSALEAAEALGIPRNTVIRRADSGAHPDYRWLAPSTEQARKYHAFEERMIGKPVAEPAPWKYDGGKQRAPVLDPNFDPPRVIRRVGWRKCMCCSKPMWSEDVARIRMCLDCGGFGGQPKSRPRNPIQAT